jgi:hypothetical protein
MGYETINGFKKKTRAGKAYKIVIMDINDLKVIPDWMNNSTENTREFYVQLSDKGGLFQIVEDGSSEPVQKEVKVDDIKEDVPF